MIVGLGFVARSGKDTAAEGLVRELGFKRYGFADQLKALALEANPLVTPVTRTVNIGIGHGKLQHIVAGLRWEGAKDQYTEVRTFLENLGKGARTVFGDRFWVDQLMQSLPEDENAVIADVRYLNEIDAIRDRGGMVIKIQRPGHEASTLRPSEIELREYDGWDAVVHNNRSTAELQSEVVQLVRERMALRASGTEI